MRSGRTVAVILHQPGLLHNTMAVQEVALAAQLALDNERLRAELRARGARATGIAGTDRRGR